MTRVLRDATGVDILRLTHRANVAWERLQDAKRRAGNAARRVSDPDVAEARAAYKAAAEDLADAAAGGRVVDTVPDTSADTENEPKHPAQGAFLVVPPR